MSSEIAVKKERKKPVHYVDNKKLLEAMKDFRKALNKAKKAKEPMPRIPPYVGECIMKISTHLAFRPNFSNYPFREEMISDGIENCLQYIENFDPKKSENPFAYFTQIIYYAFLRRIQKEKKFLYTKHAARQFAQITGGMTNNQEHDTEHRADIQYGEWSQEQMLRFMEEFEEHKRKRRKKVLDNAEQ